MFIIENNDAYIIDGNCAKLVQFTIDKEMEISDKDILEDIEGKQKYTYDEVLRKLNVDYNIEQTLLEEEKNADVKELHDKIKLLEEENKQLKDKITELTKKQNKDSEEDKDKNKDE